MSEAQQTQTRTRDVTEARQNYNEYTYEITDDTVRGTYHKAAFRVEGQTVEEAEDEDLGSVEIETRDINQYADLQDTEYKTYRLVLIDDDEAHVIDMRKRASNPNPSVWKSNWDVNKTTPAGKIKMKYKTNNYDVETGATLTRIPRDIIKHYDAVYAVQVHRHTAGRTAPLGNPIHELERAVELRTSD